MLLYMKYQLHDFYKNITSDYHLYIVNTNSTNVEDKFYKIKLKHEYNCDVDCIPEYEVVRRIRFKR